MALAGDGVERGLRSAFLHGAICGSGALSDRGKRQLAGCVCPLMKNRLCKHRVNSLGVIDKLCDAQINRQRTEHVGLVA